MEIDIEKLNECLIAGIINEKSQIVVDDFWNKCANVSKKHQRIEGQTREHILAMMTDDLHSIIFNTSTPNNGVNPTSQDAEQI